MVASYLFFPYVRPDGWGAPLLSVGWTLNYEVMFYTLFGLCVMMSRRSAVLTLSALLSALIALQLTFGGFPNPWGYWCNPLIIEFAFGMLIALAYREGYRIPNWLGHILIASGFAVLAWSWNQAHFFAPPSWMRVAVWGLPALAIIGSLALRETPVPRNLFWRVSGFLGDASYSIYLVHTLTLGVPLMVLGRWLNPVAWPWLYLFAIATVMMVSSLLIYLYVEKPITEALQRRIEGNRRPQGAAVADIRP